MTTPTRPAVAQASQRPRRTNKLDMSLFLDPAKRHRDANPPFYQIRDAARASTSPNVLAQCVMHVDFRPWEYTPREGFTLRGWHSPPTGKPLIHFLHGNGFCGRMYEPMLMHLLAHFDLWLSDVQGHGDSDHGGKFVGWNRCAQLAVEAFEHVGTAFRQVPLFGVGHSFGGVLTGLILGEHPHLFRRAVLLDPVILTPTMLMGMSVAEMTGISQQTPLARQARSRRKHWASRDEAFELLHNRGVYKGWTEDALRAYVNHALKDSPDGGVELKCRRSREAEIFSSAPDRLWSLLGRVRTPTLALHAARTYPFVAESIARWMMVNDAVSSQQVEGRHCFMQEHPQATAHRIQHFLLGH
jgi:pimeloyl-ACP methyl ester carboxylesterase